jgi:response regulator RpfG family c-di-GMP phosphodiesterase
MLEKKIKVLFVDDEENNLFSFKAVFRLKFKVFTAISADAALLILNENPDIQVVITDQRMPEITGVEFLQILVDKHPNPVRVMLTGYANLGDTIDAVNKGKIFHYLNKPWKEDELESTIIRAFEKYTSETETKLRADRTELAERNSDQMEFLLRQKLLS